MKKLGLLFILAVLAFATLASSQDGGKIPDYLAYDGKLVLQKEHFRKATVDLAASCFSAPTDYYTVIGPSTIDNPYLPALPSIPPNYPPYQYPPPTPGCDSAGQPAPGSNLGANAGGGWAIYFSPNNLYRLDIFYFDAKGNGKIDPGEWLDKNGNGLIDNGEWKDGGIVYAKMYKRIEGSNYKEIDYSRYIFPKSDPHVVNISIDGVMTPVMFFRLEMCEYCDLVGDTAYFEDEFARITFNFQGITRESSQEKMGECEGCFQATLTYYLKLQIYVHQKYDLIFDSTDLHNQEPRPLTEYALVERHADSGPTPNVYDAGEAVVEDFDNSKTFSMYDVVVLGTPPLLGSSLVDFAANEKYVDSNLSLRYENGEAIVRDVNLNGVYDAGELIVGNAPTGSPLTPFRSSISASGYYYTYEEEKTDAKWGITQVIPFDPYYLTVNGSTWLTLYETDGGKALILPKSQEQEQYGFVTRWSDMNGNGVRDTPDGYIGIRLADIFRIKTQEHEEVDIAKILVTPIDGSDRFIIKTNAYKVFTVYYTPDDKKFRNEIIFPDCWVDSNGNGNIDSGEMVQADFGFIVTKMDAENEKIWIKFIKRVDAVNIPINLEEECIPPPQDIQIVFDMFDRALAKKCCEFPLKRIDRVPKFSRVLVDIITKSSSLVDSVTLRYQDLKGDLNVRQYLEEQPHAFDQVTTRVTAIDMKKFISNMPGACPGYAPAGCLPNPGGAHDFSGAGWAGPPAAAPGVVPGPAPNFHPVPNWQVSDRDFSGTAIPGDLLTFWVYLTNGSLGPMTVDVTDVVPAELANIPLNQDNTSPYIFNNGVCNDTNNNDVCEPGETIEWNGVVIPPGGSVTLVFQASVLSTVPYGGSITNTAIVTYCEFGSIQTLTSEPVVVNIAAMQMVKQAYSGIVPGAGNPITTITEGGQYHYRIYYYVTNEWLPGVTSPSFAGAQITEIRDTVPFGVSYSGFATDAGATPLVGPAFNVVLPIAQGNPEIIWQLPEAAVIPAANGNPLNAGWGYAWYIVTVDSPPTTYTILNDASITYYRNNPPTYSLDGETSIWDNTHDQNEVDIVTATGSYIFPPSKLDPQTACVTDAEIGKSADAYTISPGLPITYTIDFTNTGTGPYADIYNVIITDRVPDGIDMTSVVAGPSGGVATGITGTVDIPSRTITWYIPSMKAGQNGSVSWTGNVERSIIVNQYLVRVYEYKMFEKTKENDVMLGGILGDGFFKITPDDITKVTSDSIFVQVYEESRKIERYLLSIFERKVYDNLYAVDFTDVNEEKKNAHFELFSRVKPNLAATLHWGVYDCTNCELETNDLMSGDEFLLHVLLKNQGTGLAQDFEYSLDAPSFQPKEVTWIYDTDNPLPLQVPKLVMNPDEYAGLVFEMKAPEVRNETTYPVKVKLRFKDEMGRIYSIERKVFLNVKHQKRGQIEIIKHVVEGKNKSVSEDTKTEKVSLNVGEKRTIHVYLRNTSEKKISGIKYMEIPPRGISIVEGSREWKGSLDAGGTADFIFKIEAVQTGVYRLQAKVTYELSNQIFEAAGNVVEVSIVGEKGPTIEKETDVTQTEKGGIINVVIKVSNDTKGAFKNIQVMEVVPKGFVVDEILTPEFKKKDDVLICQIDELKPEKYILFKYTLKAGETPGIYGFLGTRAVYEDSSKIKQEITSTDTELHIITAVGPELAINIDVKERESLLSQEENMTVIVEIFNGGGIAAKDVSFVLPIPETTKLIDHSGNPLKSDGGLAYKIDSISAGDTIVIKYTLKALHTTENRIIKIGVDAIYTDEFRREYKSKKEAQFDIQAKKPIVKLSRALDKNALKVNYPFIITTSITNEGESQASVDFKDEMPEGFKVITGQNTWTGTLKPGDAITVSYEVMANKVGIYDKFWETAVAKFKAQDGTEYTARLEGEDETQRLVVQGVLVTKGVDRQSLFVDEVSVVTIRIKNIYKEKATSITVKDSLPEGVELVEGATEWKLEKLEPDESVTYTYTLKFKNEGDITLPVILSTFKDVYGDRHETSSTSDPYPLVIKVTYLEGKKPTPPPTETVPPETQPPKIIQIFRFQPIWIAILVALVIIAGMIAILFIEQRRAEREEEKERIEQLTPEQLRTELWRKTAEERRELLTERKRPPPGEGLPPRAYKGEEEEEKKPTLRDRIFGKKPEEKEEEIRAPPILKEEEKEAPSAIGERLEAVRKRKERTRGITEHADIREIIEEKEEELPDLQRLIYGEKKEEEKIVSPRDVLKERERRIKEAPPKPETEEKEEYFVPPMLEKYRKKEEEEAEPKSLRELIEEKGEVPERPEIKEIKRPSYLERILREKEEKPEERKEAPKRTLEEILKKRPEERKIEAEEEEEEEEDELPDPKDLLKKNGNNNKK